MQEEEIRPAVTYCLKLKSSVFLYAMISYRECEMIAALGKPVVPDVYI
jgi:hypothetical protein